MEESLSKLGKLNFNEFIRSLFDTMHANYNKIAANFRLYVFTDNDNNEEMFSGIVCFNSPFVNSLLIIAWYAWRVNSYINKKQRRIIF